MKKKLFSLLFVLLIFFSLIPLANKAFAQCAASGASCPGTGINGGCCTGSCYNTATVGFTGVCSSTGPPGGLPFGTPCTGNASCASGVCASGFCTNPAPPGGVGIWGQLNTGPTLQSISDLLGINRPQSASNTSFQSVISFIITLLLALAMILSLFYFVFGGYDWITSQGDKQKLESARHKIYFAIVGLVVAFVSFMLINIILQMFGVQSGGTSAPPPPSTTCVSGTGSTPSSCGGHSHYTCTSTNPPPNGTCCDFTYRCSGSSCIAACHAGVSTGLCPRGTCGP